MHNTQTLTQIHMHSHTHTHMNSASVQACKQLTQAKQEQTIAAMLNSTIAASTGMPVIK